MVILISLVLLTLSPTHIMSTAVWTVGGALCKLDSRSKKDRSKKKKKFYKTRLTWSTSPPLTNVVIFCARLNFASCQEGKVSPGGRTLRAGSLAGGALHGRINKSP